MKTSRADQVEEDTEAEGEERQAFSFARDLREERGRGGEKESDCSK